MHWKEYDKETLALNLAIAIRKLNGKLVYTAEEFSIQYGEEEEVGVEFDFDSVLVDLDGNDFDEYQEGTTLLDGWRIRMTVKEPK